MTLEQPGLDSDLPNGSGQERGATPETFNHPFKSNSNGKDEFIKKYHLEATLSTIPKSTKLKEN